MEKRYPDCTNEGCTCTECSLSNYGRDCHNNPISALAHYRAVAGLTQQQLADTTGISVSTLRQYEQGTRNISGVALKNAVLIADALGLDDLRDLLK